MAGIPERTGAYRGQSYEQASNTGIIPLRKHLIMQVAEQAMLAMQQIQHWDRF